MTKTYVGKEACPQCGSKDNVGVWSDGQKWCFSSCGYFVPGHSGLSIESIRTQLGSNYNNNNKKGTNASAHLPNDFSLLLRDDAAAWVAKYGITDGERCKFHIGWSDVYESLVLPASDCYGNWLVVQRRYFGNGPWPKYHTSGSPESVVWSVSGNSATGFGGTVVIVEDFISALKVGRQFEATPLWGSNISDRKLKLLSDRYERLGIWLDQDKTREAMQFRFRAAPYFRETFVISTEKDPKDYDDLNIKAYIANASRR